MHLASDTEYNIEMNVSDILTPLNEAQQQAVSAPPGPLLVLAGAGSGKTRVLTHRIAWLVRTQEVSPLAILAVTFTNKASHEMRARIETLLDIPIRNMWVGTFHALCYRLLRLHFEAAGLPSSFEVLDNNDQRGLVRRVLRGLELDETLWPLRQMQWMINQHKEEGRRATDLPEGRDVGQQTLHKVYVHYENECRRLGLVDFAELLLRTLELFRQNQVIREAYQQRFEQILVDEFQDTNSIQYQWLRLISKTHNNLFAVGDDDQSIYGWRGARVENLLHFEKDFPGATVIRLEQNYRSSGNILNAANAVIAKNVGRLGKELWTDGGAGTPIRLYSASNEIDEARFVIKNIQDWLKDGRRRDDAAILYRSNAQSRIFEEELMSARLPYQVYGGMRFFERAEIKNVLAYMRLLTSHDSDQAFDRIVNFPPRGIGDKTIDVIRERARQNEKSLWQTSTEIIASNELPARATSRVREFQQCIDSMTNAMGGRDLGEITEHVLVHSGILAHYKEQRGERAISQVENLEELVNAARNFSPEEVEEDSLAQFLSHAALESGERQEGEDDCVQLMTLHSAKGLEFQLVFLCGMEEGLFPHSRSIQEPRGIEEERRLCYVGMTRAREQLTICHANSRRLYRQVYTRRSRFIGEIPAEYIEEIQATRFAYKPPKMARTMEKTTTYSVNGFTPGQQVRHKSFGEGTIISLEGQGDHARINVNFVDFGRKCLVCAYANLEVI